jgi:predicted HTH transcriptional regulator
VKVPVQKSRKAAMAESETCEFKKSLAELKDGSVSIAAILDQHNFEGDILEMIEEGQKYILKNIHIGMRLNGLGPRPAPHSRKGTPGRVRGCRRHLHLTTRAIEKQMAKLQREGHLRRIGPDKGGHWEVMP